MLPLPLTIIQPEDQLDFGFFVPYFDRLVMRLPTPPYMPTSVFLSAIEQYGTCMTYQIHSTSHKMIPHTWAVLRPAPSHQYYRVLLHIVTCTQIVNHHSTVHPMHKLLNIPSFRSPIFPRIYIQAFAMSPAPAFLTNSRPPFQHSPALSAFHTVSNIPSPGI